MYCDTKYDYTHYISTYEYFSYVKILNKFHPLSSQPSRSDTERTRILYYIIVHTYFLYDRIFYSTSYNSLIGQFDHNNTYTYT